VNSGIQSIYVLIQFKSQSLLQHLRDGWEFSAVMKSQYIIPVPAQMRSPGETWYRGTADAIFQNINLLEQSDPHVVAIFGADHIYRMNVRQMIEFHEQKRAQATISAIPVPRELAAEFGVIETAPTGRILRFHEKNPDAPSMPGNPNMVLASMGNYIFSTGPLLKFLYEDARLEDSSHDFGRDILPKWVESGEVFAYDFGTNIIPGDPPGAPVYWRDVGTIDAYYDANMDLRAVAPVLNLYNRQWPTRTAGYDDPPAKFTFDEEGRRGTAIDSIVSSGSILSGGMVRNSVLGRNVRVHTGSLVEDSIVFDNCNIARRCKIRRAILDKNVVLLEDTVIGYDLASDRKRYHVTDSGIVMVEGRRSRVPVSSIEI
jgi:glucose-1-phosphate adenylyltransferase